MVSLQVFSSTHDYQQFSEQYSKLRIEGTYYLAFEPLGELIERYGLKGRSLDFGCGAGRSTRFLKTLGFDVVGVDKSLSMLQHAQRSIGGTYYLLDSEKLPFPAASFNLAFQSFVLLEYASIPEMISTFKELNRVLTSNGAAIVVTGSEDYYRRNWCSFQLEHDENLNLSAGSTAKVMIQGTDIVLFDYYWTDADYRHVFEQSGFNVVEMVQPLARGDEPFDWVNEREFPCWSIYVLKK